MPIHKRNKNSKYKYIILAVLIILAFGIIWSFANNPVFTEIVLYP